MDMTLPRGIQYIVRGNCQQFRVSFLNQDGRRTTRNFAVSKFGKKGAYDAAMQLLELSRSRSALIRQGKKELRKEIVYQPNCDGTTTMHLRYKDTPIIYVVDSNEVDRLQTKTWSVTDEGYAVTTTPMMTYMHRFLAGAKSGEFVFHLNRDVTDCRMINLYLTSESHIGPYTIGSVNTLMSQRGKTRTEERVRLMHQLKDECVKCQFSDPRALQFDHLSRKDKSFNISKCSSSARILVEIEKCQILCAFCHSLKTAGEHEYRDTKKRLKRRLFTNLVNDLKLARFQACEHCARPVTKGQEQAFHLDHINPFEKLSDISALANHGISLDVLLQEIEKTRLLCANCHAIRTAEQHSSGEINALKHANVAKKMEQMI